MKNVQGIKRHIQIIKDISGHFYPPVPLGDPSWVCPELPISNRKVLWAVTAVPPSQAHWSRCHRSHCSLPSQRSPVRPEHAVRQDRTRGRQKAWPISGRLTPPVTPGQLLTNPVINRKISSLNTGPTLQSFHLKTSSVPAPSMQAHLQLMRTAAVHVRTWGKIF